MQAPFAGWRRWMERGSAFRIRRNYVELCGIIMEINDLRRFDRSPALRQCYSTCPYFRGKPNRVKHQFWSNLVKFGQNPPIA
jgi:hypothetical protein